MDVLDIGDTLYTSIGLPTLPGTLPRVGFTYIRWRKNRKLWFCYTFSADYDGGHTVSYQLATLGYSARPGRPDIRKSACGSNFIQLQRLDEVPPIHKHTHPSKTSMSSFIIVLLVQLFTLFSVNKRDFEK